MREIFRSGSVGRAPGNRCLYPETSTSIKRNGGIKNGASIPAVVAAADSVYKFKKILDSRRILALNSRKFIWSFLTWR